MLLGLYPQLVALGTVSSLLGLLSHENTDISLDVIELLSELTDPEAFAETDSATALLDALVHQYSLFTHKLCTMSVRLSLSVLSAVYTIATSRVAGLMWLTGQVDNKAFDLLVQNLSRLDESSPEDAKV